MVVGGRGVVVGLVSIGTGVIGLLRELDYLNVFSFANSLLLDDLTDVDPANCKLWKSLHLLPVVKLSLSYCVLDVLLLLLVLTPLKGEVAAMIELDRTG